MIAKYIPPAPTEGRHVVEIGCGSGGNLELLCTFGAVLGAEPNAEAVRYAQSRERRGLEVIQHAIPEPLPRQYHCLCLFDVLEHIQDDAAALRWVEAQLVPGGIAVITVPAFQLLWTEQDEAVHHWRRYSQESLARLLPPGLELVHLTYFNTLLFPPILAVRMAMRMARRTDRAPRSHLGIPPRPINEWLYRIFSLERYWVASRRCPIGVSALLVARRRG